MIKTNKKVITIDGPAASGKTSVGKKVADHFGFLFLDTGLMYRAVTWCALNEKIPINEEELVSKLAERIVIDIFPPSKQDGRVNDVIVNNQDVTWDITRQEVNNNVSKVSAYAWVRSAMTLHQRRIGNKGDVVMVGRDIGTIVMPNAKWKFYLEASPEERARRRYQELLQQGSIQSYNQILKSIIERDEMDSSRELAPLKPADDAIIIRTDQKTLDEVVMIIINSIENEEDKYV